MTAITNARILCKLILLRRRKPVKDRIQRDFVMAFAYADLTWYLHWKVDHSYHSTCLRYIRVIIFWLRCVIFDTLENFMPCHDAKYKYCLYFHKRSKNISLFTCKLLSEFGIFDISL